MKVDEKVIAGRTLVEWQEFSRRDDCLERMVPSDLRQLVGVAYEAAKPAAASEVGELRFVFDKLPSPGGTLFIEVEDAQGRSVKAGTWRERADGLVELVVPRALSSERETVKALREEIVKLRDGLKWLVERPGVIKMTPPADIRRARALTQDGSDADVA